jgi:hypothetical protein
MATNEHEKRDEPLRPEFIDSGDTTAGGGARIDASAGLRPGGLPVGLCVLDVLEGGVLHMERLAPDDGGLVVSVATMVSDGAGWVAHEWWRSGLTVGMLPVSLELSPVVEVWRPVSRRRWWQRRPTRRYWLLPAADDHSATFWGPFGSPDELAGRSPSSGT